MATQLPAGMTARIKNILLTPSAEWPRIDAEPMTEGQIFRSWVIPLAAIGPVAGLIGGLAFGMSAMGITIRPSVTGAVLGAVFAYLSALFGTWLTAKIINALAPTFGGTPNPVAAMKVAAFGFTASYLSGIFQLLPMLAILGLLGLYTLYLIYLGLPRLMTAPANKAVGYTVAVCIAAIVVMFVLVAVVGAITSRIAPPTVMSGGTISGNLAIPGVGTVDVAKLEAASKRMEAAASGASSGGTATVTPVDATALSALLPTSTGGWTRTELESSSAGAGGIGGSNAQGTYTLGEDRVRLQVTDMAAMGALAAMGGALNIQQSRTTERGYEKTGQVDGRLTTEEWNTADRRGKYSQVIADRFLVEANGSADSIDALKSLVASVDAGTLEGMK